MKTATKLFSGLLLTSALVFGFAQDAQCKYVSTETIQTTDSKGNVTIVEKTNVDGKETTKTSKRLTMPFSFDNETKATLSKLEVKTNFDDDFKVVFENDSLKPGYVRTVSECSFDSDVKTMDFRLTDSNGNSVTIEGLDISSIKNNKEVNFLFEQDDNNVSVSLLK